MGESLAALLIDPAIPSPPPEFRGTALGWRLTPGHPVSDAAWLALAESVGVLSADDGALVLQRLAMQPRPFLGASLCEVDLGKLPGASRCAWLAKALGELIRCQVREARAEGDAVGTVPTVALFDRYVLAESELAKRTSEEYHHVVWQGIANRVDRVRAAMSRLSPAPDADAWATLRTLAERDVERVPLTTRNHLDGVGALSVLALIGSEDSARLALTSLCDRESSVAHGEPGGSDGPDSPRVTGALKVIDAHGDAQTREQTVNWMLRLASSRPPATRQAVLNWLARWADTAGLSATTRRQVQETVEQMKAAGRAGRTAPLGGPQGAK